MLEILESRKKYFLNAVGTSKKLSLITSIICNLIIYETKKPNYYLQNALVISLIFYNF